MKHLILGNGPAGVIAAETLRHADPSCDIVLAGSEDAPPYSRMAIPYLLEGTSTSPGPICARTRTITPSCASRSAEDVLWL